MAAVEPEEHTPADPRDAGDSRQRAGPARRVLSVALGVLLGVLSSEGLTRTVLPDDNWTPGSKLGTVHLTAGPGAGFRLKPNIATHFQRPWGGRVPVFTDAHGYRIPGPNVRRPSEGPEVLICGASYTWGFDLPAEEAWPFRFEAILAERGQPRRVACAAQLGHTLPIMLDVVDSVPPEEHYETVVIAIPMTGLYVFGLGFEAEGMRLANVESGFSSAADGLSDAEFESVNGWLLRADRAWANPVVDHLRTRWALGHRLIHRIRSFPEPRLEPLGRQPDLTALAARSREIGRRIRRAALTLRERGIELAMILLPTNMVALRREYTAQERTILGMLARESGGAEGLYHHLDLSQGANALPLKPGLEGDYFWTDPHYSSSGQRKVAEAVARWYDTAMIR